MRCCAEHLSPPCGAGWGGGAVPSFPCLGGAGPSILCLAGMLGSDLYDPQPQDLMGNLQTLKPSANAALFPHSSGSVDLVTASHKPAMLCTSSPALGDMKVPQISSATWPTVTRRIPSTPTKPRSRAGSRDAGLLPVPFFWCGAGGGRDTGARHRAASPGTSPSKPIRELPGAGISLLPAFGFLSLLPSPLMVDALESCRGPAVHPRGSEQTLIQPARDGGREEGFPNAANLPPGLCKPCLLQGCFSPNGTAR